jgi:hypothetical protein
MNATIASTFKAAVAALLALGVCAPALAQAGPGGPPSYARPSYANDEAHFAGRITAIYGPYDLDVRDSHNYTVRIHLHDGTIINPTGLKLSVGQSIQVHGLKQPSSIEANEIDSPYHMSGYAYGPAYSYPAYWGYGPWYGPWYGPALGIGIGIGWRGYYGRWGGWVWRGWHGWR